MRKITSGRYLFILLVGLVLGGCAAPVKLPDIDTSQARVLEQPPYRFRATVAATGLDNKVISLPAAGEKNSYGLVVTQELASAYDAYLAGDGQAGLAALDRIAASGQPAMQWHVSFFRAQMLIMMGRAADAEAELATTMRLEQQLFGNSLNSRALRGEARLWLGDYASAVGDFSHVILAIGDWQLPTSYGGPPTNLAALVSLTTAQLRSYVGMAGVASLQGRHADAARWARQAEQRFSDVHYVANHPLYGPHLPVHVDSYYGRAINLGFLATAELAGGDAGAAQNHYRQARDYFGALGYQHGLATLAALEAYALLERGERAQAITAADRALAVAVPLRVNDLVWRIETLRGKALFEDGRFDEAEQSLRRAEAAVATVSGALASDRARRRFGVGKDEITYYLSWLDRRNGKLARLLDDLESGRARAFVDLLAERRLPAGRGGELVRNIRRLDRELRVATASLAAIRRGNGRQDLVADLYREREAALAQLLAADPELAEVFVGRFDRAARIQQALAAGERLVYSLPARADDRLAFLVVSRQRLAIHETAVSEADLEEDLGLFLDAVLKNNGKRQQRIAAALRDALGVSGWAGNGTTYFVAAGQSYFIPWGALATAAPVIVLPNASWLNRARAVQQQQRRAVVVGDPDFAGSLPQLGGALAEAQTVASEYRGAQLLTGSQATVGKLRRSVGDGVTVMHLATHGRFDAADPMRSAIVLSGGQLTAADLLAEPVPARLVVLSACETGLGEVASGDDLLGLSRSLYLGGSRAVLASLWPVQDKGTRLYMETFHRELRESGDLGKAWLQARDKLKAAGFNAGVYAAFNLAGSRYLQR